MLRRRVGLPITRPKIAYGNHEGDLSSLRKRDAPTWGAGDGDAKTALSAAVQRSDSRFISASLQPLSALATSKSA